MLICTIKTSMTKLNDWKFWGLVSLTLGLAPFYPEPHIVGKVQWILGGAEGILFMDWFDVVLHGTSWVIFLMLW